MTSWSADELDLVGAAGELQIAVRRLDGELGSFTPIWVVCAAAQVYVRSWHRRDTGWFGRALETRRTTIRVAGLEADVTIEDIGTGSSELAAGVDAAYRAKYGERGAASMVTAAAVDTTLRLDRE
ncbi:MAG: hypothetical protein JWM76_1370 [Pseudonocardiales bacterium]|nr:hypothetical protein [Pseudonocardiales bacterium]